MKQYFWLGGLRLLADGCWLELYPQKVTRLHHETTSTTSATITLSALWSLPMILQWKMGKMVYMAFPTPYITRRPSIQKSQWENQGMESRAVIFPVNHMSDQYFACINICFGTFVWFFLGRDHLQRWSLGIKFQMRLIQFPPWTHYCGQSNIVRILCTRPPWFKKDKLSLSCIYGKHINHECAILYLSKIHLHQNKNGFKSSLIMQKTYMKGLHTGWLSIEYFWRFCMIAQWWSKLGILHLHPGA